MGILLGLFDGTTVMGIFEGFADGALVNGTLEGFIVGFIVGFVVKVVLAGEDDTPLVMGGFTIGLLVIGNKEDPEIIGTEELGGSEIEVGVADGEDVEGEAFGEIVG